MKDLHTVPVRFSISVAAVALALAGCASAPPDRVLQSSPDFARAELAASIRLARDGWPEARWWTRYRDAQLDALVERALRDSPTLPVAQTRIAAAEAALASERSVGGASLGLEVGANRQRYSGNGLFPEPIGGNFYNDASVRLKAGYDFDWWGKHRAMVAAALGEVNVRRAEAAQAEQTLAAAVVQSYLRLQLLWARKDNADAMAALERQLVAERRARIERGLANIDEQRVAERDLGTLQEQAAAFATQAGREHEALRALVGGGADEFALARRPVPQGAATLPARLGLDLLARRPDLQAARWRVEATLGRTAASEAAFYPDINLAGSFGLDAVSIGRLLRPNSRTMLIGTLIDLPLFDSGRLNANLGQARAERNAAIADYNQAVFKAVAEVAAEGATLQGLERQAAAHAAAREASAALVASATRRIDHGLGDRAALLAARQQVLRQQDVALQQQDAALQTEVALTRALGGGFHSDPAAPASTAALSSAAH
jgi:multidrug efflux system outer membrane protein